MRHLLISSIAVAVAMISGCATVKESYSADGKKAYTLNCSGTARGWDKCFAAAGEICGTRGYSVLDRNSENTAAAGGGKDDFYAAKTNERSMLIACK